MGGSKSRTTNDALGVCEEQCRFTGRILATHAPGCSQRMADGVETSIDALNTTSDAFLEQAG